MTTTAAPPPTPTDRYAAQLIDIPDELRCVVRLYRALKVHLVLVNEFRTRAGAAMDFLRADDNANARHELNEILQLDLKDCTLRAKIKEELRISHNARTLAKPIAIRSPKEIAESVIFLGERTEGGQRYVSVSEARMVVAEEIEKDRK